MLELVQLERRQEDFAKRNTRVIVVSVEGSDDAKKTQADFPHLLVLADEGRGLTEAAGVLHVGSAPDGEDTDAPTTMIVDRGGTVRWLHRPGHVISRLSPDEVLSAIDLHLPGAK